MKLFEIEDYQGEHSAPERDGNNSLDDLSDAYPEDIYSFDGARQYGHGDPYMDNNAILIISKYRGKPNSKLTVYRAVPHELTRDEQIAELTKDMARFMKRGNMPASSTFNNSSAWYNDAYERKAKLSAMPDTNIEQLQINPGNWVTIIKRYAKEHGQAHLNNKFKIISKKVKAIELVTDANSIFEWGYSPIELNESHLQGSRAPYYHWTDDYGALWILGSNALGTIEYYNVAKSPLYDQRTRIVPGWISVSRDKRYRKGAIGFVLDQEKIHQNYKVRAYSDPFVAIDNTGDTLMGQRPGTERRWESEEKIYGPIKPLDKYLLEIWITKKGYASYERTLLFNKKHIEKMEKNKELFDQGVWIPDANHKDYVDEKTIVKIRTIALERNILSIDKYNQHIKRTENNIKEHELLFKHPLAKIIEK